MRFVPSKALTVGMELELHIVDSRTFAPAPVAENIIEKLKMRSVHREFFSSMLEIVSEPCDSPAHAVEEIKKTAGKVLDLCRERGLALMAGGTHPFADPESVPVTRNERYGRLLEEFQIVLRNFFICGLHVHVGVPDERIAVNAFNALVRYSPLFLALSASSPFFRGKETGLLSYRSKIFEQLPRAGLPQQFESYGEFEELVGRLKESGTIKTLRDVWWDVRLRPDLGTVELRICDSNPDARRLLGISALAVMVVSLAFREPFGKDFHQIHLQNRWNAGRHGLKGKFLKREGSTRIRDELLEVVRKYKKIFGGLSEKARILEDLAVRQTVSESQLLIFSRTQDLKKVSERVILKWRLSE